VRTLDSPVRYLYRVGVSRTRPRRARFLPARPEPSAADMCPDPDLARALERLSRRQRVAVVLVHAYGWKLHEVGALLRMSPSTVATHVERGLAQLRADPEVTR